MKHYIKIIFVAAFLIFANALTYAQPANVKSSRIETINGKQFYIHTVEKGQTLYGISKIYGVTVDELLEYNPDASTGLKKGAELKILSKTTAVAPTPIKTIRSDSVVKHVVKQGETLYSIANFHKVTVDGIKKHNPGLSEQLSVGDVVIIPIKVKTEEPVKNADIVEVINKGIQVDKQVQPSDTVKSSIQSVKVSKSFRGYYEVALMLPLSLSELESANAENIKSVKDINEAKSFKFIQFYEAFLIAYQQLEKQGVKVTLRVYDVVNDTNRLSKILNSSDFQNVDMMIGPFFTGTFKQASRWALQHQVFIVNPFSKRDDVMTNNPYAIKMAPSVNDEATKIVQYCAKSFPEGNIVLVHNASGDEKKMVIALKQHFLDIAPETSVKEVIYSEKGINGVKERMVEGKHSIIISLISKEAIVTNFVRRLYELKKEDILLIAPIEWASYDNIETDYLEYLHVHYFDSYFVDYSRPEVISFVKDFRNEYNTEPELSKYAFQGYDICTYFVGALMKYGYSWPEKMNEYHPSLISTNILLKRRDEKSGYENSDTQLFKLENYKYMIAE
jgi:LysM repeat protein/ABC-type branched-subunit amino acid transport system substrate-binding protein